MEMGRAPARATRPLGYRFFFVVSLTITSAAALSTARAIFPIHFFAMNRTTLLRSGRPAER